MGCHAERLSVPWRAEVMEQNDRRVRVRLTGSGRRTPWAMHREFCLRANDDAVFWKDTVFNQTGTKLPLAWLHHPGFGGPLINDARIVTAARTLMTPPSTRPELNQLEPAYRGDWPMAPQQSGGSRDCSLVPQAGSSVEHVVHLADFPVGWGCVWNDRLRLGFGIRWDESVFPYAWSWSCGAGAKSYPLWGGCHTITIQPSTSPLLPFAELVSSDALAWVEPHGALATCLSAGFVHDANAVLHLPQDDLIC